MDRKKWMEQRRKEKEARGTRGPSNNINDYLPDGGSRSYSRSPIKPRTGGVNPGDDDIGNLIQRHSASREGSPPGVPDEPAANQRYRRKALQRVYQEFDLDGGGDVGGEEMMALGQARRALGQKEGVWTREQNEALMANMGAEGEPGTVSMANFINYFDEKLEQA